VLIPRVAKLIEAGIQVALFIEPDPHQVEAAQQSGAHAVELHTGEYCNASAAKRAVELARLQWAAVQSVRMGLECHAGHGLTVENVWPVACIPEVIELNIGHSIVAEAVFDGLGAAIRDMRAAMDRARTSVA